MRILVLGLCLLFCLLVSGCGDDNPNHPPTADAGTEQNVATGTLVTLDGSASTDLDGQSLTYNWSLMAAPAGSAAVLSDTTAVRPTFTADVDGDYLFRLIVNDGTMDSNSVSITVTAATANSAPVASVGADQSVATGSLVTLDGSTSSDADNDSLNYSWSLLNAPAGSSAALSDVTAASPTFTADLAGDYVVQLIVNDGSVDSSPDTVTVTAATVNSAPVASAGADQSVAIGSLVALDGSASSDADNDSLNYSWSLLNAPAGSSAALSDVTVASPTFTADLAGDYVVQLIVNDGSVDSSPDNVTVTASTTWSPVELVINADAVSEISDYLSHPVPVRFDADTIHLYFAGRTFKLYATVPALIYRITSTDNGATWSAPERLSQLEGNYMSYPSTFYNGKLLLVWHNGSHSELFHTDLTTAADLPVAPTRYVDYASIGMEVNWASHWNGSLVGMWHSTAIANYGPFIGSIGPDTATLSGITWPFGGVFYSPTRINADQALVVTDGGLSRAGFDGSVFIAPNELLPFPDPDTSLEYAGTTLYHAAFDQASGYIYFTGYSEGGSRGAIYRTKLLR